MKRQIKLIKNQPKAYGGELLKTREGRASPRPLDTRNTIHLVLRSTKATGQWSFVRPKNKNRITQIVSKFSNKYAIKILSLANVGNHLHFQIKLSNRFTYFPFIRAVTAAIAMAVTESSRWSPLKKSAKDKFWDYRPFTRVVQSFRGFLNLRDYIRINQVVGLGYRRNEARFIISQSSSLYRAGPPVVR